jgi:hypothetical protein
MMRSQAQATFRLVRGRLLASHWAGAHSAQRGVVLGNFESESAAEWTRLVDPFRNGDLHWDESATATETGR